MSLGKNTIYYNTISSPNQYDIKLKIFKPQEIHGIVIACHGLCSSKENSEYWKLVMVHMFLY